MLLGDLRSVGTVPAGLIEEEDRVGAGVTVLAISSR